MTWLKLLNCERIIIVKMIKGKKCSTGESDSGDRTISVSEMFRFASKADVFMIIVGLIASIGVGGCTPLFYYFIIGFNKSYYESDHDKQYAAGFESMMECIYVGIAAFGLGWLMTVMWVITGQRQSSKCRQAYYQSLLSQDAEFFDCNEHSFINSKFDLDTNYFQIAIGEKIGVILQVAGNFITGMIISFWQGWFMTFIMLASIVVVVIASFFNMRSVKNKESKFVEIYSRAGGRAEEAISAIKFVKQFNAQDYQLNIYTNYLRGEPNEKFWSIFKISLSLGMINSLVFFIYSLGYWMGEKCLSNSRICLYSSYTPENVHVIFFCQLLCLLEFTTLTPAIKQIILGKDAAQRIFKIIDRVPQIKMLHEGIRPDNIVKIEFKNVSFAYPKNKTQKVLDNFSLVFDLHSSALVGQSGCGKSTIAQLLMRFYDPDQGEVLIDDQNIKQLDLVWLRSRIGYVGQEPVLFAATIRQNLLYANPSATDEQIVDALKQAEIYDFVFSHLEKGLETQVGVGGSQISGGQKQRIAIARALIKQPYLLILDEATSALDRINERAIQQTLNKISEKMTTITIAHRISTIKEVRTVFVIKEGKVHEQGKFENLHFFNDNNANNKEDKQDQQKYMKHSNDNNPNLAISSSNIFLGNHQPVSNVTKQTIPEQLLPSSLSDPKQIHKTDNEEIFTRIFSFNKDRKLVFGFSILISVAIGLIFPVFSIFISQVFIEVSDSQYDHSDNSKNSINTSSLKFLITGFVTFFLYFLQTLCGQIVGNQVLTNLRAATYRKILRMPVAWFGRSENVCGAISSKLSVQCERVKELITTYIYIIVRCVTIVVSGFIIMFVYNWIISLAIIGFVVVLIISGFIKSHFRTKIAKQSDILSKKTSGMIEESLINIRTVSAFNMQKILISQYERKLKTPLESLTIIGVVSGLMNGIGLFIVNSVFGILLYIGIFIMENKGADKLSILTSIFQFNFIALILAKNFAFLPDVESLKISAKNIFNILDGEDEEQMQQRQGSKRLTEKFKGNIQFRNVSFKYEDRHHQVLSNLDLTIREGEKTALVGSSGCGKSTLVQLLLRFYEPTAGEIFVGGTPLRDYDLAFLRSQFGVVAQEPVVFNSSFRDNIRYNTTATEQQIRDAAIQANALNLIEKPLTEVMQKEQGNRNDQFKKRKEKIPQTEVKICLEEQIVQKQYHSHQGLNREVGVRGFHISGGQKQRVAIARVLLRSPKVLLLDQATSALDAKNQFEVQQALDKAMAEKTIITIAHRIQTIKDSHAIHVFAKGKLDESGTYQQLLERNRTFWKMVNGEAQ